MSKTWIEAMIAWNEDIVACERRFHRQCIRVANLVEHDAVTARDEMLLASYMTSLNLARVHRDDLLAEATASA